MMTEEELRVIEKQLSCPEGELGIRVGDTMNASNIGMTLNSISFLSIKNNDSILELGHGNCGHLSKLMAEAVNIHYTGIEISETMHAEAKNKNAGFITANKAGFVLYDGINIPFADNSFSGGFTVNTIYFWKNPVAMLNEIARVLKPEGSFIICFAHKSFIQSLPFVGSVFTLYNKEDLEALLANTNLKIQAIQERKEKVKSKTGEDAERIYSMVKVRKR